MCAFVGVLLKWTREYFCSKNLQAKHLLIPTFQPPPTAVLLKIQVFCNFAQCQLINTFRGITKPSSSGLSIGINIYQRFGAACCLHIPAHKKGVTTNTLKMDAASFSEKTIITIYTILFTILLSYPRKLECSG